MSTLKCVIGIDLGSTTTKAVMLDLDAHVIGRGITNSRSNYEVACAVARIEAVTNARFNLLERAMVELGGEKARAHVSPLREAFKLELFLGDLEDLKRTIDAQLDGSTRADKEKLRTAVREVLTRVEKAAPGLFLDGAPRKSDFFRDLAGQGYVAEAEALAKDAGVGFEALVALYDRAILDVETRLRPRDTRGLLRTSLDRLVKRGAFDAATQALATKAIDTAMSHVLEELVVVGTGYGRQTLPFPKESVRSEILCHGRGAHRTYPGTRTVLDIGGQDTKAIQVDDQGVVTSFQMNDRCAAGCGRYLGYIADELNLGLHELGPLALEAEKVIKVNSTCTVFAGAELRERLGLGQRREDILAGLHRAIMLRAMSLLARSGGVKTEFTFTGGVCNNAAATKVLRELVDENYGKEVVLNMSPDSIYMGALGAALFGIDDVKAGVLPELPAFVKAHAMEASA